MAEENVNLVENETASEAEQEPQYVNGLFCFHAVSEDRTQRFCTYRLYREDTDPQLVAQDARDWFRLQMRISEVNERFSLIITHVINI